MNRKIMLICISIFVLFPIIGQEKNSPKFGKGLFNLVGKDSSWTMKVGLRFQTLAISTWDINNGLQNNATSMLIRRSRLKFDGYAFSPKLKYKLELGLSNRDKSGGSAYTGNTPRQVMDAVLKWNFSGNWVLWFGQTKLPGNRERVISSADLQQVDRSLLNSRFNIDRDIGFQLRHKFNLSKNFLVKEIFALSQGEGRNVTTGNEGGYQYTSRIELFPFGDFKSKGDYKGSDLKFEETPKLSLAFSYDINKDAVRNRSNMGSYMINDTGLYSTDISTVFIDAMLKYKGFSFMGEYANRTAEDAFAKNSDGSLTGDLVLVGNGLNLQTGYLLTKTLELSLRYTNISYDKKVITRGNENEYTLGVSKYISGHKLKIQSDVSYTDNELIDNRLMCRLQVDIHF
ncbi:MAG: porin [Flavobacteriaceae bacterium]|nr:porin [Flavobacteriaceae bacterium]